MMRTYLQSTKLERRAARAAMNTATPGGEGRINQAAMEWGRFVISLAIGCAAVVAAFAVIIVVTTEPARSVGPFIVAILVLVWAGRALRKSATFRRALRT